MPKKQKDIFEWISQVSDEAKEFGLIVTYSLFAFQEHDARMNIEVSDQHIVSVLSSCNCTDENARRVAWVELRLLEAQYKLARYALTGKGGEMAGIYRWRIARETGDEVALLLSQCEDAYRHWKGHFPNDITLDPFIELARKVLVPGDPGSGGQETRNGQ